MQAGGKTTELQGDQSIGAVEGVIGGDGGMGDEESGGGQDNGFANCPANTVSNSVCVMPSKV